MNVATHETGHILSIQNCTYYEYNMNGSNNLEESDRSPLHYCPVCTRKLCYTLGLDPAKRLLSLNPFLEENHFDGELAWSLRAIGLLR
jgi:archaemetzincin